MPKTGTQEGTISRKVPNQMNGILSSHQTFYLHLYCDSHLIYFASSLIKHTFLYGTIFFQREGFQYKILNNIIIKYINIMTNITKSTYSKKST